MISPEIRLCVVGFGSIARTHLAALRALPAVRQLPLRPVADTVVTRRAAESERELRTLGVQHVVTTVEEALRIARPDAVIVAGTNDRHLADSRPVLEAGLPLYLEKPLGRTAEEAAEICRLAAGSPGPFQVGLVMRYHPAAVLAGAMVRRRAIGRVRQARLSTFHGSYLNPERPLSWRMTGERAGGGAMLDLGVHLLDLARGVLGDLELERWSRRTVVRGRGDVDDWAWAELRAEGDASVIVEASRIAYGAEGSRLELYGTEGSLIADLDSPAAPRLRRFDGRESDWRSQAEADDRVVRIRDLLPPERLSLGLFTDLHAASLHHFLLRVAGHDPDPALAPSFHDSEVAERLVAEMGAARQPVGVGGG